VIYHAHHCQLVWGEGGGDGGDDTSECHVDAKLSKRAINSGLIGPFCCMADLTDDEMASTVCSAVASGMGLSASRSLPQQAMKIRHSSCILSIGNRTQNLLPLLP